MRRALVFASVGGLAAAVWAWFRRRRPEPEPAATASETDPHVEDADGRLDDETKYGDAGESEVENRRAAADRLRADPLSGRLEAPPDDAA